MSRNNRRAKGSKNPVTVSVDYRPNLGEFTMYDRDTKKRYDEITSLNVIIIDADRFCISGFNKKTKGNYRSTLVKHTKEQPMKLVRLSGGKAHELGEGLYADLKEQYKDIKFSKPVIFLVEVEGEWKMAQLTLTGVAKTTFMEWFDTNEDESYDSITTITTSKDMYEWDEEEEDSVKKDTAKRKSIPQTWYHLLEFTMDKASEELIADSVVAEEQFTSYYGTGELKEATKQEPVPAGDDADPEEEVKDKMPF